MILQLLWVDNILVFQVGQEISQVLNDGLSLLALCLPERYLATRGRIRVFTDLDILANVVDYDLFMIGGGWSLSMMLSFRSLLIVLLTEDHKLFVYFCDRCGLRLH